MAYLEAFEVFLYKDAEIYMEKEKRFKYKRSEVSELILEGGCKEMPLLIYIKHKQFRIEGCLLI